jgi:hypothetical protein
MPRHWQPSCLDLADFVDLAQQGLKLLFVFMGLVSKLVHQCRPDLRSHGAVVSPVLVFISIGLR